MAASDATTTVKSRVETLACFTSFLGSLCLKEHCHNSASPKSMGSTNDGKVIPQCISEILASVKRCSVPSLALAVHSNDHQHDYSSRDEIEECATESLSKPLVYDFHYQQEQDCTKNVDNLRLEYPTGMHLNESTTDSINVLSIPEIILHNLEESFFTLVDARLRAYLRILAGHALSVSECDQEGESATEIQDKISDLIHLGTNVMVANVITLFQCSAHDPQQSQEEIALGISMKMTMDVKIPSAGLKSKFTSLQVNTTGNVIGTFCNKGKLVSVDLQLDTHELLNQLMDQAAHVIALVLDQVTAAHTNSSSKRGRGIKEDTNQLATVTPELKPQSTVVGKRPMSPFSLGDTDFSTLSAESCEHIIDTVIGEMDIINPPQRKRIKTSL